MKCSLKVVRNRCPINLFDDEQTLDIYLTKRSHGTCPKDPKRVLRRLRGVRTDRSIPLQLTSGYRFYRLTETKQLIARMLAELDLSYTMKLRFPNSETQ